MNSVTIATTTTVAKHYDYKGYVTVTRKEYAVDPTYIPNNSVYNIALCLQYINNAQSYTLNPSDWTVVYKVFNNDNLIATQTTKFVWPVESLELIPNHVHTLYDIPITLPNTGEKYNVQIKIARNTGIPTFNVDASFNTAIMTIAPTVSCSFLKTDFTNKHLSVGWVAVPNAHYYRVVLYRLAATSDTKELIKTLNISQALTAEVTASNKDVWNKLKPGDKVYWGVTPVTNTGVSAQEIVTDPVTGRLSEKMNFIGVGMCDALEGASPLDKGCELTLQGYVVFNNGTISYQNIPVPGSTTGDTFTIYTNGTNWYIEYVTYLLGSPTEILVEMV